MAIKTIYVDMTDGAVSQSEKNGANWLKVSVVRPDHVYPLALLYYAVSILDDKMDKRGIIKDAIASAKNGQTVYDVDTEHYYIEKSVYRDGKVLSDAEYRMYCIDDAVDDANEIIKNGEKPQTAKEFYSFLFELWLDYAHDFIHLKKMNEQDAFETIKGLKDDIFVYLNLPSQYRSAQWQKDLAYKKQQLVNLSYMYTFADRALHDLNSKYDNLRSINATDIKRQNWNVLNEY